ncbi:hypothetical protein LRM35_27150 [Klebsiella variicola subsp. variicola]|nr:hypothetical protein LRM35_27150 [Klebsiella variicola subsp. variicola]
MWLTLEVTQPRATAWSESRAPRRLATVSACPPAGAAGAHRACRRSGSYRQRRVWQIRVGSQCWTIDRRTGLLSRWSVGGQEQLLTPA